MTNNGQIVAKEGYASRGDTLQDLLLALTRYGRVFLMTSDNGKWKSWVDMHVEETGSKFEIRSEYHDTPVAAVQQLTERIEAALAKWR